MTINTSSLCTLFRCMASTRQHGAEKLCDWFSDKLICICDGLSIILVQRAGEALLPHTSGSRTIPGHPRSLQGLHLNIKWSPGLRFTSVTYKPSKIYETRRIFRKNGTWRASCWGLLAAVHVPRSCNILLVRVTVAITPQFSTCDHFSRIVLV